jgi:hypothetical protein
MTMRTRISRAAAVALASAVALTSLDLAPASAAGNAPGTQATKASTSIDLSARRRHYRHRGNAAVLGAVAGIFGAIAATAAANSYRHRYYYGEPYYYGSYGYGAPYAYAPAPYAYGPSFRFHGHRGYGHHRHR